MNMPEIDWNMLRLKASKVMNQAYAPYSQFPVGSVGLVSDGRLVAGCNVENVSYGLGLCAECVLVGNLQVTGGGRLIAITCCDARSRVLTPCGRCRQVLLEHGGPDLLVDHASGPVTLRTLLPDAFGPDDLAAVRG